MITNIKLGNFKCFQELDISPKQLTILIGPNGTGKSSVLQALLLLKQSVGKWQIEYQGDFINLNGRDDVVPNFLDSRPLMYFGFSAMQSDEKFAYFYDEFDLGPSLFSTENPLYLKQLRIVPAARGLGRPQYPLQTQNVEQIPPAAGLDAQEAQLASTLAYSRQIEEPLSNLLKKITGAGLRAETTPPQSVAIKSTTPHGPVNIITEGFGANALILLLQQLLTAENGATILIEEPEIHLHPKAQAELAQTLAETAKTQNKQLIITTHSEYITGRLLTLIAEKRLTPDDLAIYSFEKDEKGECTTSPIEITERGQAKGGLRGFHDATRDEMRRYVDSLRNQ